MNPNPSQTHLVTLMVALFTTMLASCGPLPQPFRGAPSVASNNPLINIPTAVGVAILPIVGAPEPFSSQLTAAIAERLRTLGVPAEAVRYNAGLGFSLEGQVDSANQSPNGVIAEITWALSSRAGEISGTEQQKIEVAEPIWRGDDASNVAQLSKNAAKAALSMLGDDTSPIRTPPRSVAIAPNLPSVSVLPVEGAPGDGRESLMLAVLQSLILNGLQRDDISPDVVLHCEVINTPYDNRLQRVEIIWRAQLRDGTELGTMKLDNTIPVGALDGTWGSTAFAIADAAASDLLNLLASAPNIRKPANP